MRDAISYDVVYTKLSAFLVVWEREVSRSGQIPDTSDDTIDRRVRTSYIGYGSQYARISTKLNTTRETSHILPFAVNTFSIFW